MTESVWDYPRPPRAERTPRRIVVTHAGRLVADSRGAVRVLETSHPPVYYVPPGDVRVPLRRVDHGSFCEFKGAATYWDVVVDDEVVRRAAWSYEQPAPGYEQLTGLLAFYPSKFDRCTVDGEPVTAQPGDFYGGWITTDLAGPFKGAPGTMGW
ncbi:hypothetical protein Cs7R123_11460 [Catellatospora sp. TT07R-123]|uniref:DUF427 domain-containing protein n=1 Tax=Catellatospora sp. TT07R-123 TaxID=2733863 RepID=UPI001B2F602A|nr:DUF427 domain-containing protein [Catellatospora sp. TT07R-123]GHJ43804.1 hypothetical protein Cs7R123_11460 [Catellatospora sp. TT07R-123]